MEKEIKAKRVKKQPEYALKDGDWKVLVKMLHTQDKLWADIMEEQLSFLFEAINVNQMLLCDLYEAQGKNPLNYCKTLVCYYVYHHWSLESDLPGLCVKKGKVYDADGTEIPYPEMYAAKEEGKTFNTALNEQFAKENDEM